MKGILEENGSLIPISFLGSINRLCVILGETEFEIGDVRRPITTWLTLSDSRHNNSPFGELMFSLSYLPTAERLTVVVVKARNLKLNEDQSNNPTQNVFVKVTTLVYAFRTKIN